LGEIEGDELRVSLFISSVVFKVNSYQWAHYYDSAHWKRCAIDCCPLAPSRSVKITNLL